MAFKSRVLLISVLLSSLLPGGHLLAQSRLDPNRDCAKLLVPRLITGSTARRAEAIQALRALSTHNRTRHALVGVARETILGRAAALRAEILRDPSVAARTYDAIIIGAGPHGLVTALNLKQANPTARVLIVDQSPDLLSHFSTERYRINSPESEANGSTNTLIGAPVQPGSLATETFSAATILDSPRLLALASLEADFLLGSPARRIYDRSQPEGTSAWPAPSAVRIEGLPVFWAEFAILAPGLGDPVVPFNDPRSLELVTMLKRHRIFTVNDVIGMTRNGESLPPGTYMIVGKGDGGNIMYEQLLEDPSVEEIIWVGQTATTPEEFIAANKRRYHYLAQDLFRGKLASRKKVRLIPDYALSLGVDENELLWLSVGEIDRRTGGKTARSSVKASHMILATGYRNNLMSHFPAGSRLENFQTPVATSFGYAASTTVARRVVLANGQPTGAFVAGPGGGQLATDQELSVLVTKNAASLEANIPRSAALGRHIGEALPRRSTSSEGSTGTVRKITLTNASAEADSQHRFEFPELSQVRSFPKEAFETWLRLQLDAALEPYSLPANSQIHVRVRRRSSGRTRITIRGLDTGSAQVLAIRLHSEAETLLAYLLKSGGTVEFTIPVNASGFPVGDAIRIRR